ncbi:hypothetical protein [Novosphingobium sp. 9U]|uniref:hypothetical protein n=1 Tax=Novosphingobium sp. 9U TaxID=2653158 RepID=UPI0012F28ECC|nr:hypothetical protein [Novosphingobium sp. 9U]VWX52977.1 conserved hypothetical protein [Novosphingobium sp. 9U]
MRVWSVTFGELEAALAEMHDVAASKRTAFQARLKNFHRLAFPPEFEAVKGRAAQYTPAQAYEMALAVELTQLGLPPDRATTVLSWNRFETTMAARMATDTLASLGSSAGAPLQMFIYFDPNALSPLTNRPDDSVSVDAESFFYGGADVIAEYLRLFEPGTSPRLSMVNVTSMLAAFDAALPVGYLAALSSWTREVDELEYGNVDYAIARLKEARRHGLKSEAYKLALTELIETSNGRHS